MIIKEIIIENYLCYYGIKKFNLSEGLNIILGENGEGKTKFFEAIEWICSTNSDDLELLVSKKALHKCQKNDSFRVRVELVVSQHDETKILTKQYTVTKTADNRCNVTNSSLTGIEEASNGERNPVNGENLLEEIFPVKIRKYSMFKGEEELNIFDNSEALKNLIELFSNAKYYEKYETKAEYLKNSAENAVSLGSKNNLKNKKEYDIIDADIKYYNGVKNRNSNLLDQTNENLIKTNENIEGVRKFVNNAEALEIINRRISKIKTEISNTENLINENYTTSLFDESWILMNFEKIHYEFSNKVAKLSKERRITQSNFDKEIGIKEGEKRAKISLFNDLVPLPIGTPTKAIMDEMIIEKLCKVCNRPAKEGSDALKFMQDRLGEYIDSQKKYTKEEEPETEKLFKFNYVNRLVSVSTSQEDNLSKIKSINSEITEVYEFNQERKNDLAQLNKKLEKEIEERSKIIGNSNIGSEKLGVVLKDYEEWQKDIIDFNKNLNKYESEIKENETKLKILKTQKDKIDLTNANSFLINTRNILRDIETILKDTKERKFDEFIDLLSVKSNEFLTKINVDAFTGIINFKIIKRGSNIKVEIQLLDEKGIRFFPNKSLETSMHISVLLAISELTKEVRDQRYPIMFDAATSSFGQSKMTEFLNLIYETKNQTIILMKDYLAKDENKNLYIKSEFKDVKKNKAFWLRLERPFEEKNLNTINTEKIEL